MIKIQVIADDDPNALADLIAATQGGEIGDQKLANMATFVRAQQATTGVGRPWQERDTVNFKKLDDENDWSEV